MKSVKLVFPILILFFNFTIISGESGQKSQIKSVKQIHQEQVVLNVNDFDGPNRMLIKLQTDNFNQTKKMVLLK